MKDRHVNDYHFVTMWQVEGTCTEVSDVLADPLDLPRWWPAVYLQVDEIRPADARGLGRTVRLKTKGWLPYTLAWDFTVVEARRPFGFTIDAQGDFVGRGVWTFAQQGPIVDVTYDWRIRAEKPLLRRLSFLLKPVFEANHRWAMAQGETSLRLELLRRRAVGEAEWNAVPPPPGPVTYAGVALVGGAAVIGATLACLLMRARRRSHTRRSPRRSLGADS